MRRAWIGAVVAGAMAFAPTPAAETRFVPLAEGLTAPRKGAPIEARPRMFATPSLGEACAGVPVPSKLVAASETMRVEAGADWPLSSLSIVAVNAEGRVLPRVPVAIEVEEIQPPLFDLRAFETVTGPPRIFRAGAVRLRVRTICVEPAKSVVLNVIASGGTTTPSPLADEDLLRLAEAFRLGPLIGDRVVPGWGATPFPVVIVTEDHDVFVGEGAPADFLRVGSPAPIDRPLATRPRAFDTNLLATFPAFGSGPVAIVGRPEATKKTGTAWILTLLHEHFHQMQMGHPGYYDATERLGRTGGDTSGGWMLSYPFPYAAQDVASAFDSLSKLAAAALESDSVEERTRFWRRYRQLLGGLSESDRKYLEFQLWQEGVARYVELRTAEEAARVEAPAAEVVALPGHEAYAAAAARMRQALLTELKQSSLAKAKRPAFYALGAAVALMLDIDDPSWKRRYFSQMFVLEAPES